MEYYDADAVAEESFADRYGKEKPTLCDCGEVAEKGSVYCSTCLDIIDYIMHVALTDLMIDMDVDAYKAGEMMTFWLEHETEFEERRKQKNVKALQRVEKD